MKLPKNALLHFTLCLSVILSSCSPMSSSSNQSTPMVDHTDLQMLIDRGDKDANLIVRELELKSTRTYEDFIDLGTAYLWIGEYLKAAESYEVAAQHADTSLKLVGALYNKASALSYAGNMQEALRTTDFMAKLSPDNIEVARLRCALYRYSGNRLGLMAAVDQLSTIDPSSVGQEVMDPVTGAVIILSVIVVAATTTTITSIALVPPEDRKDIVVPLMNGYNKVLGEVAKVTGEVLSDRLLKAIR